MSLVVQRLDYSGLYNALGAKRTGAMAKLQADNTRLGEIQGFTGILLDAGSAILGMVKDSKIAEAKIDVQNFEQKAQQKARDYILNNNYDITDSGTERQANEMGGIGGADVSAAGEGQKSIKLPDEYDQWYKDSLEGINKKYAGFPDVRNWASDQLYQTYDSAKKTALNTFYAKTMDDRAKQEQVLISNAMKDSVSHEDFSFTDAALRSARSLSPTQKATARLALLDEFNYGVKSNKVQKEATDGGFDAATSLVDTWSNSKEITPEQADKLRQEATNSTNIAAGTWQSRASTGFYADVANGLDAEAAMNKNLAVVPNAFKGDTEKVLRADYQAKVTMTDAVADKEMLTFHAENPDNPVALLEKLRNKDNNYGKRMQTSTYSYWEDRALREISATTKTEGDGTTLEGLKALNTINLNTYMTPEQKVKAIQDLTHQTLTDATGKPILDAAGNKQYIVGPKVEDTYLGWARDKDHMNPDLAEAYERLTKWVTTETAKLGPGSDAKQVMLVSNALRQFGVGMDKMRGQAKGGVPTKDEIDSLAADVMRGNYQLRPGPSQTIRFDRPVDVEAIFRATQQKGIIPNALTQAAIQEFGTRNIPEVYGAGVTARVIGSEQVSRDAKTWGSPMYEVMGLREAPTLPFYMRYGMDDRGRMSLQVLDDRGNWVPPTDLTTLAQHNATQAIASSKMLQKAAAARTEEHAAAFQASNLPKLTPIQAQNFDDAINLPRKPKDLAALAQQLSRSFGLQITAEDLQREAAARGYWK